MSPYPGRLRRALRLAPRFVLPALVSWVPVLYGHLLHVGLYFGEVRFGIWLGLLALPPLALEVWFTRRFEARRRGWSGVVRLGLVLRLLATLLCFWLFVWESLRLADTPNIVFPLLSKWPGVLRVAWTAVPRLALLLGVALLALYVVLTVWGHRLRLVTTLVLPALATYALFHVFYFTPESAWRGPAVTPGAAVERVFPPGARPPVEFGERFYPRDLVVAADDSGLVATYGKTFGGDNWHRPNVLHLDLDSRAFTFRRYDTVRRIASDDASRVFFAPWHDAALYDYHVAENRVAAFPLPAMLDGWPVEEVMATHYAADRDTVYVINNRNPVVFAWDVRARALREPLLLAREEGVRPGDSIAALTRAAGRLYLAMLGRYQLAEIDEETLTVRRLTTLPHDAIEVQAAPDGRLVYAPAFFAPGVMRVDTESLEVVDILPAPMQCRTGAFSPDGARFFLASYMTGELLAYDTSQATAPRRLHVGPKPEGIYATASYVYVSTATGIVRVARAAID